jgi:hypothetical protein
MDSAALKALGDTLGSGDAILSKINAELARRGLPPSTGVKTAPTVAPLPVAYKDSPFFLVLIVSMPITRAEFNAADAKFKEAIAAAAGINPDNVDILSVTESRRRAGSVDVETKLRTMDAAALKALGDTLGNGDAMLSKINAELARRGLPPSTGVKTAPTVAPLPVAYKDSPFFLVLFSRPYCFHADYASRI